MQISKNLFSKFFFSINSGSSENYIIMSDDIVKPTNQVEPLNIERTEKDSLDLEKKPQGAGEDIKKKALS